MQNERVASTENGSMRKLYVVSWDKIPQQISKKTGLPVKDYYQTVNPVDAERVAEARRNEGKINVEVNVRRC